MWNALSFKSSATIQTYGFINRLLSEPLKPVAHHRGKIPELKMRTHSTLWNTHLSSGDGCVEAFKKVYVILWSLSLVELLSSCNLQITLEIDFPPDPNVLNVFIETLYSVWALRIGSSWLVTTLPVASKFPFPFHCVHQSYQNGCLSDRRAVFEQPFPRKSETSIQGFKQWFERVQNQGRW